jgi:putative ABC transport system permease protein
MYTLRQILESFRFAGKALKSNLLRTILSLLGVTVGIFAIISVLTIVDSLENNVKASFNFLGTGVIYVSKRPWGPPPDGEEFKWWEYNRRPNPSHKDYRFLEANLKYKGAIAIYAIKGGCVIKSGSNSIGQVVLRGGSVDYDKIFELKIKEGRYFTNEEIEIGKNIALIGHEVQKALFPNDTSVVGKEIKIKNLKFVVVGSVVREGQSFLGIPTNDYSVIIPYNAFRKMYLTGTGRADEAGSAIGIKGIDSDAGLVELENELRGFLRVRRGLKPMEKDNFSLNRPEGIVKSIEPVFDVLSAAGWVIGGFSILVGGFGIANIMFVSVKERTSIIGLQKSLGAKNYFILFQFLFEAVFLSLIGGLAGLCLVYLITFIPMGSLEVKLTIQNIVLGLGVSSIIGLVSGIVPAAMAARLDPVIAIRAT